MKLYLGLERGLDNTMGLSTGFCGKVWKFDDFSITQILHEINFGDSASAKSAIFTHLKVLDFALYEIMHFLKAEMY